MPYKDLFFHKGSTTEDESDQNVKCIVFGHAPNNIGFYEGKDFEIKFRYGANAL